jgi:hypothetical protein
MNLKTLLGSCLAASLLAACSGGGGSVAPTSGMANSGGAGGGGITQGVAIRINAPFSVGATSSTRRSPNYIGTNVTTIAYTFLPGPITGSFANTGPQTFSGCVASGVPVVQTCNVIAGPGTYSLTVTLKQGGVVVGSGTASGIVVTSGSMVAAPVSINPVNSAPTLSIPNAPTAFYNDGQMQNISLTENELDPAGDIITTYYGPVGNYPTLTLTDSGGTANVTLPVSNPIMAAPSAQGGNTGQVLTYTGAGNAATSLTVSLSDGVSSSQVVIPYISLANNANNPTPGNVTFAGIGASNTQQVTVTESTSAASGGLDTNLVSSSSLMACGAHATFSPALGTNATSIAGPTASVTYTITAVDTAITTCELDVASPNDPFLTTPITLNFPGSVGVGVTGHSRR